MDYIKSHCPTFAKGTACPYATKALKGLAKGCPEFKKSGGCPFKDVKDIGEFKAKLGEMRDNHNCKAKESHTKAIEVSYVNKRMYSHLDLTYSRTKSFFCSLCMPPMAKL